MVYEISRNERVAMAILSHRWPGLNWGNVSETVRESYRETARRAIEAYEAKDEE